MEPRRLVAAVAFALVATGAGLQQAAARPLDVTILYFGCVDPCRNEGIEAAGESAPDFYAKVFINGHETITQRAPDDQQAVGVSFLVVEEVPDNINDVPVAIQVWDHDSTSGDDLGDATPVVGRANLEFVFHRDTGTVTGDVTSVAACSRGQPGGEPGGGLLGADPKPAVEVCFVVQEDPDSDGDALFDSWETRGIDANADGTPDITLPGANPLRADVYVWADWMDCAVADGDCESGETHSDKPEQAAIDKVVNAFAGAPHRNPDGTTGIALHVEFGKAVKHGRFTKLAGACDAGPCTTVTDPSQVKSFDDIKLASLGADNHRRFSHRYALFAHSQYSFDGSSGCAELGGNDLLISVGGWTSDLSFERLRAGTLMHELGHTLGLKHGGNEHVNFKPNRISVMNYPFQFGIYGPGESNDTLDYAHGVHRELDENMLYEPDGIGGMGIEKTFRWNFADAKLEWMSGVGAVDWNGVNGNMETTRYAANINGDFDDRNVNCKLDDGEQTFQRYSEYDDWANLDFDFRDSPDFADGVHQPLGEAEQTLVQLSAIAPADLQVAIAAAPEPVVTGSNVTYTIEVANVGGSPAPNVMVSDTLPASLGFVSCAATGGGSCGGTGNSRTVSFASLGIGARETITLVANVTCALPDGTTIQNTASADSPAPERDPSDDQATAVTTASNPPPVVSNVTVSLPVIQPSPNHKLVGEVVGYTVTDNCGPVGTALSVTSNEPINGLGDGDQAPDWVIQDANRLQLRAERSGLGSGRIYTVTVTATDSAGGTGTGSASVSVPLSQKK